MASHGARERKEPCPRGAQHASLACVCRLTHLHLGALALAIVLINVLVTPLDVVGLLLLVLHQDPLPLIALRHFNRRLRLQLCQLLLHLAHLAPLLQKQRGL
jgi:hypothetical protein